MFKWLASQFQREGEDSDSLGSERGLERFIAALPVTVPARTVEALGEPFETARALDLDPARLGRALKRLDERAQEPLEAVWESLFEDEHGRNVADGAWLVLARFHRNVHLGYEVWLEHFRSSTEHADKERADAVLLACRSMAALGRYKALLRMRYRDVDSWYWEHLHALASWTNAAGGGRTLIELYPDSGYQTSVEREYLIALAYDAAPVANLLPAQLLALDLLLRRLATHLHFADGYRDSAPFATGAGREPGVRRWLKGLKPRPDQRFFGVGGAYAQLATLRKQAARETPQWLARARLDSSSYPALLDLLLAHWSTQPPQRRHRRSRCNGEVLVSRGVAQVRRMIAASEYAQAGGRLSYDESTPYDFKLFGKLRFGSVDQPVAQADASAPASSPLETLQKFELEGDRQMTERWTMTDQSESGFGAIAPAHGGWARAGMLIGYRRLDGLDWHLAAVRRLNRTPEGKLSVGAEAIEGETLCARVRIGSGDAGNPWVAVAGTADAYHDAILLRDGTHARILLEPGMFGQTRECMLSFEGVWHHARLERCLKQGYDYDLVEVSLLDPGASQSPAAPGSAN